jgi:hypothetical protein
MARMRAAAVTIVSAGWHDSSTRTPARAQGFDASTPGQRRRLATTSVGSSASMPSAASVRW